MASWRYSNVVSKLYQPPLSTKVIYSDTIKQKIRFITFFEKHTKNAMDIEHLSGHNMTFLHKVKLFGVNKSSYIFSCI